MGTKQIGTNADQPGHRASERAGAGGSAHVPVAGAAGAIGTGSGGSSGVDCEPACASSRECCDGICVNLATDPFNCGACGNPCSAGEYCNGQCVPIPCTETCESQSACCGTACCGQDELCCAVHGPIPLDGPRCLPVTQGACPQGCAPLCKCVSPTTLIATPLGVRAIKDLQVGDDVYSVDRGEVKSVPIIEIRRSAVENHQVVRLALEGGRVLDVSASHPTADGGQIGDLKSGDVIDGVRIIGSNTVPYQHDATYDILPASDTGAYFAAGVLIGSTLAQTPSLIQTSTAPSSRLSP